MSAPARPWYREGLVWLVIAIPGAAVVMGIVTAVLAVRSDDGLVADDYYRRGLEVARVLDRDHRARALGLAGAVLVPARSAGRVRVEVRGRTGAPPAGPVRLRVLHPTRAGLDREVELVPAGSGVWTGPWQPLEPGRWHLQVEGPDWRLAGRAEEGDPGPWALAPAS